MATGTIKNPQAVTTGTATANVGTILAQSITKCGNVVSIYISISGSFAPNQTIATLPSGFRPSTTQRVLATFDYAGSKAVTVFSVNSSGAIFASYGSSTISGIIFYGTIIL